jgi:mannitol/fructose-specific phosphotransferase system IIA component (Ntr-type)/predicted transcriptional regulator
MQLTNHLEAAQVMVGCDGIDKVRLLERMIDALLQPQVLRLNPSLSRDTVRAAILQREEERATVISGGLAFPHARIRGFCGIGMALAVLERPIDFGGDTPGGVYVVCMVVVPQEAPMVTLKVMSRVANFFRNDATRATLLSAESSAEVIALLSTSDLSLDIPVTARDILTPPGAQVRTATPLREVTGVMHARRLDVVAVVDDQGRLVGEITSDGLFQFGLPEFFQHLKSVSFISEFDPFEKYFETEAHSNAQQLMNEDVCRMSPDATLLEIVFALAVKRRPQVYVVDAGNKWIGTVDRAAVLNNVLNW